MNDDERKIDEINSSNNDESQSYYDIKSSEPCHLILIGSFPFFFMGNWFIGLLLLLVGLMGMLAQAIKDVRKLDNNTNGSAHTTSLIDIAKRHNFNLDFNSLDANEIVEQMQKLMEQLNEIPTIRTCGNEIDMSNESKDSVNELLATCLNELMMRYSELTTTAKSNTDNENQIEQRKMESYISSLSLICQEAAYVVFDNELLLQCDVLVSTALSTLALVAKNVFVRERHLLEADKYGIDKPIKAMNDALERAKKVANDTEPIDSDDVDNNNDVFYDNDKGEQNQAELQRKGCLFLGALSDGDTDMTGLVLSEGGIEAIVQAVDWFRYHQFVANWALWALFTICYDNVYNKVELIRCDGIRVTIQSLRNCSLDSIDVTRHGVAILFDLIVRQSIIPESKLTTIKFGSKAPQLDTLTVRTTALACGMSDVIFAIYEKFHDIEDITLMARELLRGTLHEKEIV